MMGAAQEWRDALRRSVEPQVIVDAAPEPPGPLEPGGSAEIPMRMRGNRCTVRRRALEALPDGGSVLDVGVGGGASSLGLVPGAGLIVVELSAHSPLAALNPRWKVIHGVDRRGAGGIGLHGPRRGREDMVLPPRFQEVTPELVAFSRRRSMSGPERDGEISDSSGPVRRRSNWLPRCGGLERPEGCVDRASAGAPCQCPQAVAQCLSTFAPIRSRHPD